MSLAWWICTVTTCRWSVLEIFQSARSFRWREGGLPITSIECVKLRVRGGYLATYWAHRQGKGIYVLVLHLEFGWISFIPQKVQFSFLWVCLLTHRCHILIKLSKVSEKNAHLTPLCILHVHFTHSCFTGVVKYETLTKINIKPCTSSLDALWGSLKAQRCFETSSCIHILDDYANMLMFMIPKSIKQSVCLSTADHCSLVFVSMLTSEDQCCCKKKLKIFCCVCLLFILFKSFYMF